MTAPNHDKLRNSLPSLLTHLQGWLENEQRLRTLLDLGPDQTLEVLRLRRNYKFRKLTLQVGNERYVCYRHYWPRGLRNLAWFSEQARLAGVEVPQPLVVHTAWSDLIRHRAFSLVLPYIEGKQLSPAADIRAVAALGDSLGRLHGITQSNWGPLLRNFPSRGSYWEGLRRYWQHTAKQLQKNASFAEPRDIHTVMQWLRVQGRFLQNYTTFNLVHGDPASGNFLIQPDGRLCIIDCDRISFEPGPLELANALLQGYCAHHDQRLQLVESYLRSCPKTAADAWRRHARFFIAAALLWRCQRKLQWARKRPDEGRSLKRAEQAWRQLRVVLDEDTPNWEAAVEQLDQAV